MRLGMRARFNQGERVEIALGEYAGQFGRVTTAPKGADFNWKKEVYIQLDSGVVVKKPKNEVYKR